MDDIEILTANSQLLQAHAEIGDLRNKLDAARAEVWIWQRQAEQNAATIVELTSKESLCASCRHRSEAPENSRSTGTEVGSNG